MRSHPARSHDPVPVPASGPFDLGQIPSEGLPRPQNCPPQPAAWVAQGRSPPAPPCPMCHPARHRGAQCTFFFALLLPFRLRPQGFCLIVPKGPLPVPQDNQLLRAAVPVRGALVRQLLVRVLLLTVAAHVVPPLPATPLDGAFERQCPHTLLACCKHSKLTKKPVCARNRLRMCPPPPLSATHTEDRAGFPAKSTARAVDVAECRWNAM